MGHRWPREPLLVICMGFCDVDSPINIYLLNHNEQLLEWPEGQCLLSDPGEKEAQVALTIEGLQRPVFYESGHPTVPEDLSLTLVIQRVAVPMLFLPSSSHHAGCHEAEKHFEECCFHALWFTSALSRLSWVGCSLTTLLLYKCQFGLAHAECSLTITRVNVFNHYC